MNGWPASSAQQLARNPQRQHGDNVDGASRQMRGGGGRGNRRVTTKSRISSNKTNRKNEIIISIANAYENCKCILKLQTPT
jgi:hypothetical protein